jgi:hypothetical protein
VLAVIHVLGEAVGNVALALIAALILIGILLTARHKRSSSL